MQLPFGLSAYSRANGRLAQVRLVNMYAEGTPSSETGWVVITRRGTFLEYTLAGTVRGLSRADGVFNGDVFAVAGDRFYRGEAIVSTIAGEDRAEFTYTVDGLFTASGGIAYQYDGTTLTATAFPDDAPVVSIASLDNTVVAVRGDTGTVYFRIAGDTVWNALDFFSAERDPDPAVAVRALSDALYVFGTASIEVFQTTGNVETPFSRIEGLSITKGIKDRDSACKLDNTLFFVGSDNKAYRLNGVPVRVSDHGIEERIEASSTASCWTYSEAGHDFFVMKLDSETLAYDVSSGVESPRWHTLAWNVELGIYDGVRTYCGGGSNLYTLRDVTTDDGAEIERVFTIVAPTNKPGSCDCLEVQLSPGTTPLGSEPALIQLRWSDDQARTWSDWKENSTGFGGHYRTRVRYRRLGMIDAPGRVFEVRMTDPVEIRFSGVEMNPPNGGRSRG